VRVRLGFQFCLSSCCQSLLSAPECTEVIGAMSSPSSLASSATPTNTDSMENPAGGGSSSTLYLYTFLVTLILLLSVSIIIVGRSYLLRRRFRRQVEEALRNGHVLSPDAPGLIGLSNSITSKLLGPPPKLWDVWVQPATVTKPSFDTEVASSGKFPWTEVRPLSAEILPQNPRRSRMPPTLASRTSSNDSSIMLSKSWIRKRTSSSSVPTLNNTPVVAESLPEKKSVYTRRDTDSDAHAAFIESEYPFSSRKRYQSEREGEI